MKKRFNEQQIFCALELYELGSRISSICDELGISQATFYNWRKKYRGHSAKEAKCLNELEDEIKLLRRTLEQKMLENESLRKLLLKKW